MTSHSVDAATVALSAGVSAGVATFVSVAANLLLGGPMEVRKQRALEREAVRRELSESIRLQLNAVRVFGPGLSGWTCVDGKVVGFDDAFDANYDEMVASYQAIRRHLVGMEGVEPQHAVGRVVLIAGAYAARVHNFRTEAIGNPPEPLETHRADIRDDMESALALLKQTNNVLGGWSPQRQIRLMRLRKRLKDLEQLGSVRLEPKTPMSYPRTDGATVQMLRAVADEEDAGIYVHLYARFSDGRETLLLKGDGLRVASLRNPSRHELVKEVSASVGLDADQPDTAEAAGASWLEHARAIGRTGVSVSTSQLRDIPREIEIGQRLARRVND